MAKIWVLDTETKGTGAQMVPLEETQKAPAPRFPKGYVPKPRKPRAPKPPEPKRPPRFKVVDVVTGVTTAEHATARATVDLLKEVRSSVDVRIYAWQHDTETWRLLTLAEQRMLWGLRDR